MKEKADPELVCLKNFKVSSQPMSEDDCHISEGKP